MIDFDGFKETLGKVEILFKSDIVAKPSLVASTVDQWGQLSRF